MAETSLMIKDFSAEAIKKVVKKEAFFHPLTLYSGVGAVLSAVSWGLFGGPLLAGAAFNFLLLSFLGFVFNFCFRDQVIADKYLSKIRLEFEEETRRRKEKIDADLSSFSKIKDLKNIVDQAREQFGTIEEDSLVTKDLLQNKLSRGEIAFDRFLGAIEQGNLSVLDNLTRIIDMLKGISMIDVEYAEKILSKNDINPKEKATILERLKIREEELKKVVNLLGSNETAITSLSVMAVRVAEMRTNAGGDVEDAIAELRGLAERAHLYNK